MIQIGDEVRVEKLTVSDYAFHPSSAIGKTYKVVSIEADNVERPLKYGLMLGEEIIHFAENEIVKCM